MLTIHIFLQFAKCYQLKGISKFTFKYEIPTDYVAYKKFKNTSKVYSEIIVGHETAYETMQLHTITSLYLHAKSNDESVVMLKNIKLRFTYNYCDYDSNVQNKLVEKRCSNIMLILNNIDI